MSISNPSISPQPSEEGLPLQHHHHHQRRQQESETGEPNMDRHEPNPNPNPNRNLFALESILNQDYRGRRGPTGEEDIIKMHGVSSTVAPKQYSSISDVIPAMPCRKLHPRRGTSRKPRRGTPNVEKQRAIAKKLQSLIEKLKPIPFIPPKILYFSKHEKLLTKIGLWDFVHIDFDTSIRVDLIAQLMATYDAKWCCGYIDKIRISVCRTSLAHALKLPVKMMKGNVGEAGGLNLGSEKLMEEEIEFIKEILADWVLLHDEDEMWLMPNEILPSVLMINDGHPEEVDWAGLFWFMVEKELTQGEGLKDCYYASHLQHLIKWQHEELFTSSEVDFEADEMDKEVTQEEDRNDEKDENDEEVGRITEVSKEQGLVIEGPSMEVIQPQNVEEEEVVILNNINNVNEHYMNSSSVEEGRKGRGLDDTKEKNTTENELNVNAVPDDDDVLEGNGLMSILQTMPENQSGFGAQGQVYEPTPQLFHGAHHLLLPPTPSLTLNPSTRRRDKRLRTNDTFEHMQQLLERCNMMYEEKQKAGLKLNENRALLLNELQRRDRAIEHLEKTKLDDKRTRDKELYRLKRELYIMSNVVDSYKKAVKETQKSFAEFREKSQLHEESLYKDVGCGGLMLSSGEIEKLRKKQEEEERRENFLIILQKVKEANEFYAVHFEEYLKKVKTLDKKLTGLEIAVKVLTETYAEQKMKKKLGESHIGMKV